MINSPVCTGRILLFPSLVLVTDLGTTGREQHALTEKVICMLMYLPLLCLPTRPLCVHRTAAALFFFQSPQSLNLADEPCLPSYQSYLS